MLEVRFFCWVSSKAGLYKFKITKISSTKQSYVISGYQGNESYAYRKVFLYLYMYLYVKCWKSENISTRKCN